MSASSSWVTCGTLSQDRCSAGPDSRWMRVSGRTSTGPNFEKSWAGTSGMPVPAPAGGYPPRTPPSGAAGPRTPPIPSSLVIRLTGPSRRTRNRRLRDRTRRRLPRRRQVALVQGRRLLLVGQRRRLDRGPLGVEQQDRRAPVDQVANLDPQLADGARGGGGDVHG